MAEPACATDTLKRFVNNVTTSSVNERLSILAYLQPLLQKEDFPEAALKGILKHLVLTLCRYRDGKSRRAVENIIKILATHHLTKFNKFLCSVLEDFCEPYKTKAPSVGNAAAALNGLGWTCVLIRTAYKDTSSFVTDDFRKLLEVQSYLLYGALAGRPTIAQGAYKRLRRLWIEVPGSHQYYADAISQLGTKSHLLCLASCIMKFLSKAKKNDEIQKYKGVFLELYAKSVLAARTKPPGVVLECSKDILRHTDHPQFKDLLLPTLEKGMLRNPEIILDAVCQMLAGLTVDLSPYAANIGKHLATQCHSKDDQFREVAAEACRHLARQCSDSEAVEKLVRHLFGVFNGSEGKLTVMNQRLGLLSGIGNLSYNSVSGANTLQNLSGTVVEFFIPVLQNEVHEGTLVHALKMFCMWCQKFSTEVPEKLVAWFKTGIGLRSSTASVKNAYIQCLDAAFRRDTLAQGVCFIPLLLESVNRASSQPTQVPVVTEGLSAAALLLRLSQADIQGDVKLSSYWTMLQDSEKQLLVNEKFVSSASDSALITLAVLVERMVLEYSEKMTEKSLRPYYRALVYTLVQKSYNVRRQGRASVKRIYNSPGGTVLITPLIRELHCILMQLVAKRDDQKAAQETVDDRQLVEPSSVAEAIKILSCVPDPENNIDLCHSVAMDILFDAHHHYVVPTNPDCWVDIMCALKLDVAAFLAQHLSEIVTSLRNSQSISKDQQNTLSTMARCVPTVVLPEIVRLVSDLLSNSSLLTVTQGEYNIFRCPEGELYDKSVLQVGKDDNQAAANIKRENKLYSYAEQMADLDLRKELEKKKKAKSGGKDEPKLTKKQEEAMQVQLKKEAQIRRGLQELDQVLQKACDMILACVEGNSTAFRLHLPQLLQQFITLLASPLAAPRVSKTYTDLSRSALYNQDIYFRQLIVFAALRILNPNCKLDPSWCEEALKAQVARAVDMIHEETVPPKGLKISSGIHPLPAPSFCYVFPLLERILKDPSQCGEDKEESQVKVLQIIINHAKVQLNPAISGIDENGPELLPRESMLKALVYLVGTSVGMIQRMACQAVMDTVTCANGEEGNIVAGQGEVDVLLQGLLSSVTTVREVVLQALIELAEVLPMPDNDYQNSLALSQRVWVAKFDGDEGIKQLAEKLWQEGELELDPALCTTLVKDVVHTEPVVHEAAGLSLAAAVKEHKDLAEAVLSLLLDLYQEKLYLPPPVMDTFGRTISEAPPDQFEARCSIAKAIERLAPFIPEDQIKPIFGFFVQKSLGDRDTTVRKHMIDAAVAAINEHGKKNINLLLPVFEGFLAQAPDSASFDAVRQSVVILMGSLAKHLDKDDPKVKPIVAKLIETLSTPSQPVQEAVANCLPPLVPAIKQDAPDLIKKLLLLLLESENYGERRGAAYGLAGLVKGLGILSLKQQDIMSTLTEAIQNKKNPRYREGALFALEMLCLMLGRLFEPYVVHILPSLLLCFGDPNQFVREAADDTAKAVMSKLSAHGVKLILPSLLTALEEDAWRTKTGSAELLGAMAFCAPKQLSACLPSIVPKLIEVLTDSHLKVQKAGAQALKQIGSVIRNPEIQEIVPNLLDALQDPTKKTTRSLQCLLDTKFVHFIDAPSLALIMPVVQRSFMDRSTETRKMAAQIIGNMYSLTDQKDLSPYLPAVIPGLQMSLLDPVPEVRNVSSRALGAMVKGMGESGFKELVPWLMETLTTESSSVDRSGAAQGLSEVVGGLGMEKLNNLMPDIIHTAERMDIPPHIRDGYIMMYIYLPAVFGDEFIPYVGPIIPSILKALADESEFVRETALKAGQRIINLYADTAIQLLLPQLEGGLFDDNWRIRYSSVQLLGDLLYKLSGVSGKMSTETADEDDNFGTETSQQAIVRALGVETRNRVLAGLYMGRSDTALLVRQSALHVWKIIVAHTPRTLREILSTLFELLLGCLASQSYDKRQVAARTLGDIVRKLGEKVLPEIIPILERGLESNKSDQRQGVCIGLSEIMGSTSRDHVVVFADSLIPTVRKALCDPLPEVRQAAADTFDNLHANIGPRTLDDILPDLLRKLDDPEVAEFALDGLKQVMAVKSRVVLPYLVPQLTSPPVNTRALSFLSVVAGESLNKHLSKMLPAMMSAVSEKMGTPDEQQEVKYCQTVVLSINDDLGVRTVLEELLSATNHQKASYRTAAVLTLQAFCEQTRADYSEYVPQLFRGLIHLLTDSDEHVLHSSWDCLNAVTKKLDASDMLQHIPNVRQALRFAVSDYKGEELPGLCLPKKGITLILPIFREGLLNGPADLKESAAVGLGEVIRRTTADALKPSVVHITGPLIRILGERFLFSVKVAVLETLGLLLAKCGAMLRPFLPQLQTTFVKALNDPNRMVRIKAALALGKLVVIHPRVDPLFTELHNGVKASEDSSVRDTMLQALRGCITGAGSKMSVKIRKDLTATLEDMLSVGEDTTRTTAAACLGTLTQYMTGDELAVILNMQLLDTDSSVDWVIRHGRSVALSLAVKEAMEELSSDHNRIMSSVITFTRDDRVPVCLSGLRGVGYFLRYQVMKGGAPSPDLLTAVIKCMKQDSNDVKALAAQVVSYVAKSISQPLEDSVIKCFVAMLVNGTKEKNTLVRTNSECALVALFRLREGEQVYKKALTMLEGGLRDSLNEVATKVLKKTIQQPDTNDDIDDTFLV